MLNLSEMFKHKGVRGGMILAGIVIVGLAVTDDDDVRVGKARAPMQQPPMAMPFSGPSPMEMMFIPPPNGYDMALKPKMDQMPIGWYGVRPAGKTPDGCPIYVQMPVYEEVPGAFVAPVGFPMGDGRVWMPRQIEFPAKGRKRTKFISELAKELDEANRSCRMVYAMRNINGERAAELAEEGKARAKAWAKGKDLRDREHQRQMDLADRLFYHMNDNQLQHYRDGWQPVVQPVGGLQYGTPGLMVSPYDGKVYKVP